MLVLPTLKSDPMRNNLTAPKFLQRRIISPTSGAIAHKAPNQSFLFSKPQRMRRPKLSRRVPFMPPKSRGGTPPHKSHLQRFNSTNSKYATTTDACSNRGHAADLRSFLPRAEEFHRHRIAAPGGGLCRPPERTRPAVAGQRLDHAHSDTLRHARLVAADFRAVQMAGSHRRVARSSTFSRRQHLFPAPTPADAGDQRQKNAHRDIFVKQFKRRNNYYALDSKY